MLLIGTRRDPHARAVAWALARHGVQAHWFDLEYFPARRGLDYQIDAEREIVTLDGVHIPSLRAAWFRRSGPRSRDEALEGEEARFVDRECEQHLSSILLRIETSCRMTNPFSASRRSDYKPYQLGIAVAAGLQVPRTLVSNTPETIRSFAESCGGRLIYKPMSLPFFSDESGPLVLETTRIDEEHLEDDDLLSAAPGLFQEEIERTWEYRVLVLPNKVIALRFASPSEDAVDWRGAFRTGECILEGLPDRVERACRRVLGLLGLDTGCIDLALDRSGRWIFFEVNSEGQFLFMEERVPECGALRHFVGHLLDVAGYEGPRSDCSLSEFSHAAA